MTKHVSGRKVFAALLTAVLILLAFSLNSHFVIEQSNRSVELLERGQTVELHLEQLLSALKDAETGQRGYLLTQKQEYLDVHDQGSRASLAILNALPGEAEAAGIPAQQISATRDLVVRKLAELQETIEQNEKGERAEALRIVESGQGKKLMDELRTTFAKIDEATRKYVDERIEAAAAARDRAIWSNVIRTAGICAVLMAFAWLMLREFRLRDRSERALHEQEQWFRTTLLSIGDAVIATDAGGRIVVMNDIAEQLTGWKTAEAHGQPHASVFHIVNEDSRKAVESPVDRVLREDRVVGLANHTVLIDRAGREYSIDDSGAPIRNLEGVTVGVVLVFRDISERSRIERELAESAGLMRSILESSGDCIQVIDREGNLVSTNPAGLRMLQIGDIATVPGTSWAAAWRENEGKARAAIDSALAGAPGRFQVTYKRLHGVENVWDLLVMPIHGHAGEVVRVVCTLRDMSELLRAQAERERLVAVVQNSSDFISITDLAAQPVFVNAAGRQMLGMEAGSMRGTKVFDLFADSDRAFVRDQVLNDVRQSGRWTGELRMRHFQADKTIPVACDIFRIDDTSTGKPMNFATVSRDITARKLAESEREALLAGERAARSDAERISRVKDEFVATLSHELRTPLNAILGWAQLLKTGKLQGEAIEKGLDTIERNARVQSHMIDDLLDMSRIISGKIRLDVRRVDLTDVIRASIDAVRPAAEAKGIRLHTVLDPRTSLVSGDPMRLQQIAWNLLFNAVKFTPKEGKVQVVLARVNSHVELSVSDTGCGISPEFLPHIFERFRQADASTTRMFGGLGLGLAIVKQLVDLHGGSVRAQSAGVGQGATFTVELPLTLVLADDRSNSPRIQPVLPAVVPLEGIEAVLEGLKVLVVDDEEDSRELVRRFLVEAHAEVRTVGNVPDALVVFHAFRPDVVLSDIGMPGMDGYELARVIRRLSPAEGGNTPAAALTALARSEDRTRALQAGYQVQLSKPVEPSELLAVVTSLALSGRRAKGSS